LLPERLLQYAVNGREAVPRYLTVADHVWLRVLLEELQRFDGERVAQLTERLREPLPCHAPEGKLRLAIHVLERLCGRARLASRVTPRRARSALFTEAQRARDEHGPLDRTTVVAAAASKLGVSSEVLLSSLLTDLPGERRVRLPSPACTPHDLALRANLALVQGLLLRSSRVSIAVRGHARAVVRQVRLRRLICTVRVQADSGRAAIEISGPYSLFRRTTLYGRALASLVPSLRACDRFELRADALLRGRELRVALRSGDPIFPHADLPPRYDSQLEERFARDLRHAAPDLDLIREPAPLPAGDHLIFPDFSLHSRRDPGRCVWIEIVGFWTPDYLERKLARLRAARCTRLILCIDEALGCSEDMLADLPQVVRYKRRIDPQVVLLRARPLLEGEPRAE
jgi:predicted nuclease of restriction endonuclease-like RecB superfamily